METQMLVYGFILSIIASIIASWLTNVYLSRTNRKRFDKMIGEYIGYGFVDDNANPLVQKEKS